MSRSCLSHSAGRATVGAPSSVAGSAEAGSGSAATMPDGATGCTAGSGAATASRGRASGEAADAASAATAAGWGTASMTAGADVRNGNRRAVDRQHPAAVDGAARVAIRLLALGDAPERDAGDNHVERVPQPDDEHEVRDARLEGVPVGRREPA